MAADDGAAAPVPGRGPKAPGRTGRERGRDCHGRRRGPWRRSSLGSAAQSAASASALSRFSHGWSATEEQHPVAVPQSRSSPRRMLRLSPRSGWSLQNGRKAVFPGQGQNLRVLTYHHGHKTAGNGFQRPADEGFPVAPAPAAYWRRTGGRCPPPAPHIRFS